MFKKLKKWYLLLKYRKHKPVICLSRYSNGAKILTVVCDKCNYLCKDLSKITKYFDLEDMFKKAEMKIHDKGL